MLEQTKQYRISILRVVCLALLCAMVLSVSPVKSETNGIRGKIIGYDSPLTKLDLALANEDISKAEHALWRLTHMLGKGDLPSEYQPLTTERERPVKCASADARILLQSQASLSPSQQEQAASVMARPSTQISVLSPLGEFRLHYDTLGVSAVSLLDADANDIPDYIDDAASYLDSSWNYYHVTLGYLTPPPDGAAGGDAAYDVYFLSVLGYGVTFPESVGPESWDDFSSYIIVNNSFASGFPPNNDPEGSAIGALKATCAHEYFHAAQLAYDAFNELWIYESSSTWNEEVLFPEVDDNYQFLPSFYLAPDTFLTTESGAHPYGSFVWPEYLESNYGPALMRTVWEMARFYEGVDVFDSALSVYGSTLADEFLEFVEWNFFTGSRHTAGYYPGGQDYPGVVLDQPAPLIPFSAVSPAFPPDGLGSSYLPILTNASSPGLLKLDFQGVTSVRWGLQIVLKDNLGEYEINSMIAPTTGDLSFTRYDYTNWDTIFVMPMVVSRWQNDNSYTLEASVFPHGDANGSGTVNIADGIYLINMVFNSGPPAVYDELLGDANCNGVVNIADAILIINMVFNSGSEPCQ